LPRLIFLGYALITGEMMAEKEGMVCSCGMEMKAPKEQESALIAAIKFHAQRSHNMAAMKDEDVKKQLKPM